MLNTKVFRDMITNHNILKFLFLTKKNNIFLKALDGFFDLTKGLILKIDILIKNHSL